MRDNEKTEEENKNVCLCVSWNSSLGESCIGNAVWADGEGYLDGQQTGSSKNYGSGNRAEVFQNRVNVPVKVTQECWSDYVLRSILPFHIFQCEMALKNQTSYKLKWL